MHVALPISARIRGWLVVKAQVLRWLQVSKSAGRLPGSLIALEGGPWYGDFSPQLPPPFDMRDGRWQRGALDLVMHLHYILRQLRRRPMTILESESTLTERYQTTIPAAVRKALRLQKHDRIVFKVTPDGKIGRAHV